MKQYLIFLIYCFVSPLAFGLNSVFSESDITQYVFENLSTIKRQKNKNDSLNSPIPQNLLRHDKSGAIALKSLSDSDAAIKPIFENNKVTALALIAYWDWVGKGQALKVRQEFLNIAQERQRTLKETKKLPELYSKENQQFTFKRKAEFLEAEKKFYESAIELGLYFPTKRSELLKLDKVPNQVPRRYPFNKDEIEQKVEIAININSKSHQNKRQDVQSEVLLSEADNRELASNHQNHQNLYQKRHIQSEMRDLIIKYNSSTREVEKYSSELESSKNQVDLEQQRFYQGLSSFDLLNKKEQEMVDIRLMRIHALTKAEQFRVKLNMLMLRYGIN